MTKTKVYNGLAGYGRQAYLKFRDDLVIFDNSEGEYGAISFPISLLKEKLKEHEDKGDI